mgnify:CR=1 FL=1
MSFNAIDPRAARLAMKLLSMGWEKAGVYYYTEKLRNHPIAENLEEMDVLDRAWDLSKEDLLYNYKRDNGDI